MKSSLNRIFKVIWSQVQMAWVAVSEATTAHGKQQSITRITRTITTVAMLTGGAAIAAPPAVNQLPTGGQVAAGIAAIGTNGNTMTVTQSSNKAVINWTGFDIGSQAAVNFVQPSSNAVALNRVNSPNPSQIYGQLSANGQVYLINAAGVYFAPGAQVNVGGIVATTMQMSDAAFMAGSTTFDRNGSTGKVINEGTIQTSLNGYIAMLAPEVRNSGLLLAQSGTVAMGAGERITLNFGPTSKLDSITVTEAQLDTLVENRSAIKAPNGLVILSARAANQLAASVVNSGTIEAKGVSQQGGRILLEGSTVTNTGTLDVSSDTAQAGTIQINGKNVSISGNVIATSTAANTQGGTIKVSATQGLNLTNANLNAVATNGTGGNIDLAAHQLQISDSALNADGDTRGGSIKLSATASQPNNPFHDPLNIPTLPATLAATGFTSISSRGRRGVGGIGGNVTLTGDNIRLLDNTTINVSGAFGGGNALIGGDWQGSNGVYQATTVYMGQGAIIDASATDNGNGGKVVLWSDIHNSNSLTEIAGTVLAKGGINGGQGGKVETSGHTLRVADSTVINTQGGLWLLDPTTVTIDSGSGTVGNANVGASVIASALGSNSVTISSDTWITIASSITGVTANTNTLTLKAGTYIQQSSGVSVATNGGSIVYWANANGTTGYINLLPGANITTAGGSITLGGGTNITTGYATGTTDTFFTYGIWLQGNTLNSGGGNIILRGQSSNVNAAVVDSGINMVNSALNAGTGKVSITGVALGSGSTNVQGLTFSNNTISSANTASDAISLVGDTSGVTSAGTSLAINLGTTTLQATGQGGGILLNGTSGSTGTGYEHGVDLAGVNLLAASGPIVVISSNPNSGSSSNYANLYLGGNNFFGTNNATSSSANVTLRADALTVSGTNNNISTAGTLTIEPLNASFTSALTFPISNLNLGASLSGLTLGKLGNAADITIGSGIPSIAGTITVYGGNITLNAGLTSTANGGDITLWANSNNGGSGKILLNSGANISTSGGNITLGGGADITSGFAVGNSGDSTGISLQGNVLNSGGGNIILRGMSANSSNQWFDFGINIVNNSVLNAGTGKVSLTGVGLGSGSANVQGLTFENITISSANTAADAISLVGDTSNVTSALTSLAVNIKTGTNRIQATGVGGGIVINGTSGGTGTTYEHGVDLGNTNLLAASGPVVVISSNANSGISSDYANLKLFGNTTFGTNNATASTANVTLRADAMTIIGTNNITTNGTVTIESLSDSFTNALSFPIANLTLGSAISGLTLGKSTNTANITIGSATTIAGLISVYGGNISVNGSLTTTATGGNILLKAANTISTADDLTLQTNNGSLVFWSNSNGSAAGGITLGNNLTLNTANGSTSQVSGGGDIVMGGGSNVGSTPTGYATSNANAGVRLGTDSTIKTGGGNATILGCSSVASGVAAYGKLLLDSGQGAITMSGNSSSNGITYGIAIGDAGTTIQSAKTSGTAINITGVSTSGYGIAGNLMSKARYIVATGGGDIAVNGTGGTAGILSDGFAYLASGGSISLNGSGPTGIWFKNSISTLGQMTGTAVPSSTANITLNADVITRDVAPGFFTSGNVTIQSISDSFSSAFSTASFTFGNSITWLGGLTIGKATNTQNITISSDTNISGAIAVYGGNISLNGNLTTTNATTGDINLTGNVSGASAIALAAGRLLTVNQSGSSTYGGVISGNGSSLVKASAGALTLSGTSTYNGTTNITAGTLIVSGSLSDSTVVNVSSGANYNLSANDTIGSFAGLGTINLGGYNLTTTSSASTVFDGVLAGNGNLTKGGTGTLTLNGTNTYSGTTRVNAGTLALSSDASLGTAPVSATAGSIVLNGGTLQATANFTLNAYRGINLGTSNGTFSVDPSITLNYAGIMAGTGSMTKSGNGTLVLAGANTYNGTTTISAGALQIGNGGTTGSIASTSSITNNGTLTFKRSDTISLSGGISGTGSLTQAGSGTLTLSGNSTYTGNTTIASGTLQLDSGGSINNSIGIINNGTLTYNNSIVNTAALVSGTGNISVGTASSSGTTLQLTSTLGVTGTLNVYSGNVLDLNGHSSPNAISIAGTGISSGGALINSNATAATQSGAVTLIGDASLGGSGNLTISGNIGGAYALTKIGTGTVTLSGTSTYSGNTTINGGTLSVSSDANLGTAPVSATAGNIVLNGGTLQATANFTLNANRGISLGTSNGTFSVDPSITLNYAGIMAGTGSMTKSGNGTLVLGGANTYSGNTTISAGTLIVNGSGSLGSGSYAGNFSNSGNLTFNTTTAQTLSGIVSGVGNLTQNGAGTLTLTGTNIYSGTTTIGSSANLQLGNNGTTGSIDTTSSLVNNGTLTFNRSNAVTYSAVISGTGGLSKAGSGTLSLTAANTYSGSTNVTAGTLQIGTGGTTGWVNGSSAVNISSGATFVVNRSDNVTLANTISGSGNFSTVGSNVTTLTGTATYTGTTNVTNGGIVFTNNATPSTSGFIGNGTVTIQPNGSAFSSAVTLGYTYANTLTGLTIGNATSTSNTDLTVSSAINISGPISLYGGNISVNANLITGTASSAILLKGTGNLSHAASTTVQTNGSNIVFWANSNATSNTTGSGAISLGSGASIKSSGGNIVLAGGQDTNSDGTPDGYARGVGVDGISTTGSFTIDGGAGSVVLRGTSSNKSGVSLLASTNGNLTTTTGQITITGVSEEASAIAGNSDTGVRTGGNGTITIESTSGTINISGQGSRNGVSFGLLANGSGDSLTQTIVKSGNTTADALTISGTGGHGVEFRGASSKLYATAAGGGITLNGSSDNGASSWSSAIYAPLDILAVSGPIKWVNTNATNGIYANSNITIGSKAGVSGLTSSSSDFTFTFLKVGAGTPTFAIGTSGNVTIQGVSGTDSFGQAFNSSFFGLNANNQTMSGFVFGSTGNTANVTINSNLSANGSIEVYGGNVAVNAALTANSSGVIKLKANSGNITQNASGVITTDGLALLGGNATLTNTNNNVTTLAAQNMGNLTYVNAGNLTIGTVNPTGVNATGTVNISVVSGNIDLTEAITTTNNGTTAIVLNAGSGTAAGTATGGNILVSGNGSVSVGTGGRATLYTGSVSNSTGLTALVGSGSGNFRYNSNASSTGYNSTAASLGAGTYAIYREQPTLTISSSNASIIYGNSASSAISSTAVNGDTLAQIFDNSSVPTVSVSGNTSTTGFYTAGNHSANISGPNATILGYATPTYSNGTIQIAKANLTVSGTQVANTTYNNSTAASFSNNGTLVGVVTNGSTSDVVNLTAAGNFSSKNVGTNLTVTMSDSISGADAANYNLIQPTGLTGNITPKTVTLSDTQVYSGSTQLTNVTITTGVAGETLTYSAATANSSQVADNSSNYITAITLGNQSGANATQGGLASNYVLPTLNHTNAPVTLSAAPLGISANTTYNGGTNFTNLANGTGYQLTGLVNGETITSASLTASNANVTSANNYVTGLTVVSGNASMSNYVLNSSYNGTAGNTQNTLTIGAATLTITANSTSATYGLGTNLTAVGYTTNGLVNSETIGSVTLSSAGSANTSSVGTYNITASGASGGNFTASNYNISYVNGSLSVTQANLTIIANNVSSQYGLGTTLGTTGFTSSGLANNETIGSVVLSSSGSNVTANVGSYSIVASGASGGNFTASNYNIGYANGSLSVYAANITLTAGNLSRAYGATNPTTDTVTITSGSLYNGNTLGNATVSSTATATTSAGQTANLTASAVTFTNGSASNYNITYANGTLTITQANLTITANSTSTQYGLGTNMSAVGYTTSGLANSETIGSLTLTSSGSNVSANVGSYAVVASNASGGNFTASNYNISYVNGTLGVTAANITVTAANQSRAYGAANPTSDNITITGTLYNGDTIASTANVSSTATSTTAAGQTANLTPSAANFTSGLSSNYNVSYANGTLTITQANLTITANSATSVYGQGTNLTAVGYTTSGLMNSETIGSVALNSTGSTNTSSVGTYNITASGASGGTFTASNYNISYANGSLTVNAAPLGIAFSGTYNGSTGFSNVSSGSGYTLTGLQNGETISSANLTLANANVAFTNNYVTGLSVVSGNASMSNYVLNNSYNGTAGTTRNTATLAAAQLNITAQAANMTYSGTGYTGGNVSYSGFVGSDSTGSMTGNIAYSGNSQGATNVGNYTITASGQTNSNYAITYTDGTLTINPAPLGISANGTYSGSTTVSPTSYTLTGLVNGETVTNITSVTVNNANVSGNGANYVTAIGASNGTANLANYELTQAYNASPNTTTTNAFTMAKANLTVTADNAAIFVTQSVPSSYNVSYNGFVGGQDATTSGITIGSVSNTASNGSVAGIYTLNPTNFSAANYNIATVNGTFSVLAANKLLVQTTNTNTSYGSAITYADPTVQYGYMNGNSTIVIVNLTLSNHTGNTYTYADGSSGTVTFTLGAANATYSTSNNLNVGGYQIVGSNLSQTSPNFNGTATYTGASTVNAVALTASTSNVSKVYDGTTSMNGLNISLTPIVGNDTVSASGAGAFSQANVGTNLGYNVSGLSLGGADAGNYYLTGGTSFSGNNGVITAAPLTITANSSSKQYGLTATLGTTNFTSSGLVNGETLSGVTLSSPGSTATANAGSYNITASNAVGANGFATSNYNISYVNGTLTVNPANITVTADNQSRAYGGNNPTSGNTTLTGGTLYNGDTLSTATLTSAANATSNVGNYTLSASNQTFNVGTANNYNISYVAGNLSVTQANLTVTANSTSAQYGAGTNMSAVGYTTTGLVNSETIGSVALNSTGSANTSSVGSYNITASGASGGNFTASNYNISYVNGTLTVTRANLTITANNASSQYGQGTTLGTSAFTTSALQNGETVGSVVLASTGNTTTSNVDTYNITASGASGGNFTASNYNISYVNGTLTVTRANLTITANNVISQYGLGTTLGTTAFTSSGLANNETVGSVVLTSTGSNVTTNVGSYNITASGASGGNFTASNYNISYVNGTLGVYAANITVTADNQTRLYGASNPTTGNITVSGTLYNGNTIASTANVSSTATNTTAAGQTTNLTPSAANFSNGSASNYNITYVNGTLTVNPAPLGVVSTGVYNGSTTLPPTSYTLTGLMNGETVTSVTAVSVSNANVAANTYVTGLSSGGGTANLSNYQITQAYNASPNTTTTNAFTMAKANLTVTADNASSFIGQTLPGSYNVSYNGFVGGQNGTTAGIIAGTVANSATNVSGAGTYTLTPTGFSASNYSITTVNGTYTIVPAETLMVQVGTQNAAYGTTASLTPASVQYYVNGTGVVNLTYVSNTGNTYTYNDGHGGNVTFTLSPTNATYSTSHYLNAASYQIGGSNLTQSGVNLNGTGVYTGTLAVAQQAVTASTSNVSKVYDGTTAMSGLNIGLSPVVSGDTLTAAGTGAFSQANVGTNLGYNVSGLVLGGADAGNYYLTGGTSFSGNNGVITAAPLTVTANNETKTYGSNASLSSTSFTSSGLVAGQTIGSVTLSSSGAINTANVGNYSIAISNATGGSFNASNYNISYINGTLTVNPANLGISAAGIENGSTTIVPSSYTLTGLQNGESLSVGSVTVASASPTMASNYITTLNSVTGTASLSNYRLNPGYNGTVDTNLTNRFLMTAKPAPSPVPGTASDSGAYQQIMVPGGTLLYIPLPKLQVSSSKKTYQALAFTGEVMLVADSAPENVTDPGFMAQPEAGFTDRFFDTAPRITLLPEAAGSKLVKYGERLLIVDTDGPRQRMADDPFALPQSGLQMSAPDEAAPAVSEKISFLN